MKRASTRLGLGLISASLLAEIAVGIPAVTTACHVALAWTLLAAAVRPRPSRRFRLLSVLLLLPPALVAALGLVGTALLAALSPLTLLFAAPLFVCTWHLVAIPSRVTRLLAALLAATSLNTAWLCFSAVSLQQTEHLHLAPHQGPATHTAYRPDRLYRFAISKDGNRAMVYLPMSLRTEIVELKDLSRPPQTIEDQEITRSVYSSDRSRIVAVTRHRGPLVFDGRDLSLREEATIPTPDDDARAYVGVAFDEARQQILGGLANGELLQISYPEMQLVQRSCCIVQVTPARDESLQEMLLLPGTDLLITTAWNGKVAAYDLARNRIVASRFVGPALSNIVPSADNRHIFVGSVLTGFISRLRGDDLTIVDTLHVGIGNRYMTRIGDRDDLLVSNYFTGEVTLVDWPHQTRIASVVAGPRIQWIEEVPGNEQVLVSDALGLTTIALPRLYSEHPNEHGVYRFPFYIDFLDRTVWPWGWGTEKLWQIILAIVCERLLHRSSETSAT